MAMFDKFLRVGDVVINTAAIAYVELQASHLFERDKNGNRIYKVRIVMKNCGESEGDESLVFDGDNAEALRWLLSNKANDNLGNLTDFWRDIIKAEQLDKDRDHAE